MELNPRFQHLFLFVCAFTRTNDLGLPVRGNPPDSDPPVIEVDNRQDMVFVRIRGESVCNFEHTLSSYEAQLAAAEIDIPKKEEKKRLKFLKKRFKAACDDDDGDDDDDDGDDDDDD